MSSLHLQEGCDVARMSQLPITVVLGAFWIVVGDTLSQFELGPISLSGAITAVVAALTLLFLPSYAIQSAALTQQLGPGASAGARIPWPMWGFVLFVLLSFLFNAQNGAITSSAIQNACVYLSFVGSIAFAAMTGSSLLVLRGWDLMRSFSTWYAYIALALSLLTRGVGVVNDRLLGALHSPRALAMIGLVALAAVIPGIPRNPWMKFAPFAIVAAMTFSLSRAATVIGLVSLIFLALRGKRLKHGQLTGFFLRAFAWLTMIALSSYWIIVHYAPFRDRFIAQHTTVRIGDLDFNTEGRANIWGLLLHEASDRWLLGHGVGSASQLVGETFTGLDQPHNEYLRFYFDYGVVGLALFIAGYLSLAWLTFRNARNTNHPLHWAAFIGLLNIALVAFTTNPFVFPWVMMSLGSLVGLSLALNRFELLERAS